MFKKLLLVSTTVLCLTVIAENLVIAIQADTRSSGLPSGGTHYAHKTMEIPASQPIPSVDVTIHKDRLKGYNLETKVANFRFAPENTNQAAKPGEGHAHLYINGEKITRLYSSWYYLENLKPGKNKITVSLNANSHQALVHNGKKIEDTETIDVPGSTKQ